MEGGRTWLLLAGWLSMLAAMLHLACILGGPSWYRALGAGEEFAVAAARGAWFPALATAGIAAVLAVWAAYAFSAAGALPRLPLLRSVLILIVIALSARGLAIAVPDLWRPDLSYQFKLWSSVAVLVLAACFAIGILQAWPVLSHKETMQ